MSTHTHPSDLRAPSLGHRAADAVSSVLGSWRYLIIQTTIVLIWMALNLTAFVHHWDPYPWILLNLIFSTQASYAAPLILMSQNRQAALDRAEAENAYHQIAHLHQLQEEQMKQLALLADIKAAVAQPPL